MPEKAWSIQSREGFEVHADQNKPVIAVWFVACVYVLNLTVKKDE